MRPLTQGTASATAVVRVPKVRRRVHYHAPSRVNGPAPNLGGNPEVCVMNPPRDQEINALILQRYTVTQSALGRGLLNLHLFWIRLAWRWLTVGAQTTKRLLDILGSRSEERRVEKEC